MKCTPWKSQSLSRARVFVMLVLSAAAVTTASAQTPDDLAVRGEALANQDPLALELRNQQPAGAARRGFDIGMAAAEGQTLPGPSKQKMHDSLSPAEQGGFTAAVSFSLERNRNADVAARGAAIAAADPNIAKSRTAEADVFYKLGFDIATGIFGDAGRGGLGHTSTGPGSLGIRDALSAAGQRGFNASVALLLAPQQPVAASPRRVRAGGVAAKGAAVVPINSEPAKDNHRLLSEKGPAPTMQTRSGKEVFDDYSKGVGVVNPAAGALFKGTGEFLNLVGYFGSDPDPVGDAIKRISERLNAHDARLAALEAAVQKIQDSLFRIQNLARIRQLRSFKDRLQGILDRLQPESKDRNEKIALARDAQRIAENFLFDVDRDLWNWSDMVLKAHSWQGTPMEAGRLLSPDFKPWPTLEYYTLALVTWMTAAEYASEGDKAWARQTFAADIQKHVRFLSNRPGWNTLSGTPETLPEQVESRVRGLFLPDKYPDNMVCHYGEYTSDVIGREIRLVEMIEYPAGKSDELCTVPSGLWKYPTQGEEDLQRAYGTNLMWMLADRLTRLRDYGTVREPFVGTFSAANRTIVPAFLYAVRPDGRMLWYRHDGAEQGSANLVGGTPVSEGWGDFKQVLPGGANVIHAISREGKNYWYRHDGFNTGARREWTGAKEVGSDWAGFKTVFSGGNGVFYAITKDGKLLLYRHAGHKDGAKLWENAKEVGSDWAKYKTVFSGGDGILYAITYDGKLLWFKEIGFAEGANSWLGPKEIKAKGTENWADYKQVFSAGPRTFGTPSLPTIARDKVVIYAIDADGKLWWYGHRGYGTGANFLDDRRLVSNGWGNFTSVFALLPDAAEAIR